MIITSKKESQNSVSPKVELSDTRLMNENPFAFLDESIWGRMRELNLLLEEQQVQQLKEKDKIIEHLKSQIYLKEFMLMSIDFFPFHKSPVDFSKAVSKLEQNFPNPFSEKTSFNCFVPYSSVKAMLTILSSDRQKIKSIEILQRGNVQMELDATDLQSGTFTYQLVADNIVLKSKEMVVIK